MSSRAVSGYPELEEEAEAEEDSQDLEDQTLILQKVTLLRSQWCSIYFHFLVLSGVDEEMDDYDENEFLDALANAIIDRQEKVTQLFAIVFGNISS